MKTLTPCLSGLELLSQDFVIEYLLEIKSLVSCPQNIFEKLYLSTLYKFAEYCQEMPFSEKEFNEAGGFLRRQLRLTIAVLKLRRGILLPRNAGAEMISAEEAQWTYAIFSGALFKDFYYSQLDRIVEIYGVAGDKIKKWSLLHGPLNEKSFHYQMKFINKDSIVKNDIGMDSLIGSVIPFTAEQWIRKNKFLFGQWREVLLDTASSDNDIEGIIRKAAAKAGIMLCSTKIKDVKDSNLSKKVSDKVTSFNVDDIPLKGWS